MLSSFASHFLLSNIVIAVASIVILSIKKGFHHHLSSKGQYGLWVVYLIFLFLPFVPFPKAFLHGIPSYFINLISPISMNQAIGAGTPDAASQSPVKDWMQDFTYSVNSEIPSIFHTIALMIWLIGIIFMLILAVLAVKKITFHKNSSTIILQEDILEILEGCKRALHIKKEIQIFCSEDFPSPFISGHLKPCIYLPSSLLSRAPSKELGYILLHELQHFKNKDLLIQKFMFMAGILYWFHPLVQFSLKQMRDDREIACDSCVLQLLKREEQLIYGETLIEFASKFAKTPFFETGIVGPKKQLKKRILSIANFQPDSKKTKTKQTCILVLTGILLLGFVPFLSFGKTTEAYFFQEKNEVHVDFSSYFKEYDGSFVLYEAKSDQWTIYHRENSLKRISPDSTYKIYSALFALESGVISPSENTMQWDHIPNYFDSWNQDQTLNSAMMNSVTWYFQELDEQTGIGDIRHYLKHTDYGNKDISSGIHEYWLQSSLKISPVEQVLLLKKFYSNQFQFSQENIQAVKNAILLDSSGDSVLYGKTGTGGVDGKMVNGWFVGFVESKQDTYFFATNIQANDDAYGSKAAEITLQILSDKGFYEKTE